jgi:hypothetical protein
MRQLLLRSCPGGLKTRLDSYTISTSMLKYQVEEKCTGSLGLSDSGRREKFSLRKSFGLNRIAPSQSHLWFSRFLVLF